MHDAIRNSHASVMERITDGLKLCNIANPKVSSLLFGAEKSGRISVIDSTIEELTDDSSLMIGSRGRPVKLKRHINSVMASFRSQRKRAALPTSISGLWKADLFVGDTGDDKWVGTKVKINKKDLEGAQGLRLAVVPSKQGISDKIVLDTGKNLIVVPVPYDLDFMELFLTAIQTIKFVFSRDARMPTEAEVPSSSARALAKTLVDRREAPVLELIEALAIICQPDLLRKEEDDASTDIYRASDDQDLEALLTPMPSGNY